jgi:hypothetical protein
MLTEGRSKNRCVDCGTGQPETDTNYTLISSRYGWRLSRRFERDGTKVMEWRCPGCWVRHRDGLRRPVIEQRRFGT